MIKILITGSIILYLSSLAFTSFCQVIKPSDSNSKNSVSYFLDSVKINKNQLFFDPNKIASIDVEKGNGQQATDDGFIYIKSKDPKDYNFISLRDIEKDYTKSVSASTIFMIGNDFLKDDISTYKIDFTFILNVEVLKSNEIAYLKDSAPSLKILKINLRTKENIAKADEVHIR